jgi:hypothetical protein
MANRVHNEQSITNSLFFSDGCFAGSDAMVVSGHFNAYPGADATRIIFRFGTEWIHIDCRGDLLRSVTYSREHGKCFLAGRNGLIRTYGVRGRPFTLEHVKGSMAEATISDAAQFGEIFRIRAFADQVFCCGQSAQVYRLHQGVWTHADDGLLSRDAQTLEDIDGTGPDDIYAVGMAGTIVHFNGSRWRTLDSPTDQPLSGVKCMKRGEVYICGNNGVLLRGDAEGWESIDTDSLGLNFWGLEIIGSTIYLAHVTGLIAYENGTFSEVKLPLRKKVSCNRLNASGQRLLSVGVDDIYLFDGKVWNEIVWPDNRAPRK